MSKQNQTQVFLGDQVEDRGERHVLARLRADLERLGIRARIHANFVAGPQQRQVDLLILTPDRLVHAELKNLDPRLPLTAKANGPWRQTLPDGTERSFDRSFFQQAHDTTYAISDTMHDLARHGAVPPASGKFYRQVDTVICLYPDIPAGSHLEARHHIDVVGYDTLLARLGSSGPRPTWTGEHWDTFARHLGLYPDAADSDDTPAGRARAADLADLADYRRRFSASHGTGLHELVPVAISVAENPLETLRDAVMRGQLVAVTGPSGAGKTHLARHLALAVADLGGTPVWVRCREYEPGRLPVALARSVAPFSTTPWLTLLQKAADGGSPTVLVLDGLNECPPDVRAELLEQVAALRLRLPTAALVTSSAFVPVPDDPAVLRVSTCPPGAEERALLLASYGAPVMTADDAFTSPHELALAAECAAHLAAHATRGDLYDAYVHMRAGSHAVREALRLLAHDMDRRLRPSLTTAEATIALRRGNDTGGTAQPADRIDQILASPLLNVGQGRVAFTHETFARFLTAEHLIVTSTSPAALAASLREPSHEDLQQFAVTLERDLERRHELLLEMANPKLLRTAAQGGFGAATAAPVQAAIIEELKQAQADTRAARFDAPASDTDMFGGRWHATVTRTDTQVGLLAAAGISLRDGLFTEPVAALLDVTDARCEREIRAVHGRGHRQAISLLVQSTYSQPWSQGAKDALPGSIVAHCAEFDAMMTRWQDPPSTAAATRLLTAAGVAARLRWGRLYVALAVLNPHSRDDLRRLPDLLTMAWEAQGYHLRLMALTTAASCIASVEDLTDETSDRLREVLDGFDVGSNLGLSGTLVDALAAFGDLEPAMTLEQISKDISQVLADPDNPDMWRAAERIVGMQFDNEAVFGPYSDAVGELTREQLLRLCVMAARPGGTAFHRDWTVHMIVELIEHADEAALEVLCEAAAGVETDGSMTQEAVQAHLEGVRGWAVIASELPAPPPAGTGIEKRAWRLVDQLLFGLLGGPPLDGGAATALWEELLDLCAPAAVDVLAHLYSAQTYRASHGDPSPFRRLTDTYPDQVRQLLEWAVANRERIVATLPGSFHGWRDRFIVPTLGHVGTEQTAVLLRSYVTDPQFGSDAVAAIRKIEQAQR